MNLIQLTYMIAVVDPTRTIGNEKDCGYVEKQLFSNLMCLYFTLIMQVTYGFTSITKCVSDFVHTKTLPAEKNRKRNKIIVIIFWCATFVDWLIYASVMAHFA